MSDEEKNALKFIKSLKRRKLVTDLDIFSPDNDPYWIYYFSINGFLRNEYFHVIISDCIHDRKRVLIVDTTDCKEEIEKILIKYNLL